MVDKGRGGLKYLKNNLIKGEILMIKPAKINASKGSMYVLFGSAIAVFLVGFVLDLIGAFTYSSSYINLYALIIEIVLMAFYMFASLTVMIWNPTNRGRTILIFTSIYVALSGLVSIVPDIIFLMDKWANYRVDNGTKASAIISVICSVMQVGIGAMSLVLLDHKPMASMACNFVSFLIFAVSNFVCSINYFVYGLTTLAIYCLIAVVFDFIVLFVLLQLMKKYDFERKMEPNA